MEFMKPIVDQIFRIIYFIAYRTIKLYWAIRKPKTDGALIAVWYQGQFCLCKIPIMAITVYREVT